MCVDENLCCLVGCEYGVELMFVWGWCVFVVEVCNMCGELFDLIYELVEVEGWVDEWCDCVFYLVLCGLFGDLLLDLYYFC